MRGIKPRAYSIKRHTRARDRVYRANIRGYVDAAVAFNSDFLPKIHRRLDPLTCALFPLTYRARARNSISTASDSPLSCFLLSDSPRRGYIYIRVE